MKDLVSDLFKEIDYDAKISGIETKYFTTSDYTINLQVKYFMQR